MMRQTGLRSPGRQPLLENEDYSSRGGLRKARVAEVAGGTTAECAAVCCCCPCALVDFLVLAVYKVPAGLCRKALRKKRRRMMMKNGLMQSRKWRCDDVEGHVGMISALEMGTTNNNEEAIELDKEMLDKFYSAGFWRSTSQKSEISTH